MPLAKQVNPLSKEERQILVLGLHELQARGSKLPSQLANIGKKQDLSWPVASNGYFIRNDGKLYNPRGTQADFINSGARFSLLYSGRGGGKTAAGAQKALKKIKLGESGSIMNPDFENFRISTWPEFKNWLPWDLVAPSQRHRRSEAWEPHQPFTMVFVNGAKVYCKGLKNPDSARGPNINWLWYDEAGRDENGLGWRIAIASVRVGLDPQCWATATPKPMEHWMYKFFLEKDIPKDALEAFASSSDSDKILVEAFHISLSENKENLDPGFYASLLATYPSGWMRSQEIDGDFANEGGKIGDRTWFNDRVIRSRPDRAEKRVRFWDLAASERKLAGPKTKNDPDETCGPLISRFIPDEEFAKGHENVNFKERNFCIEDQVAGYWAWEKILEAIVNTARFDGPLVTVLIEQEPASGGKNQIAAIKEEFKRHPELAGHTIKEVLARNVGDRVMAANAYWFGAAAAGRMWIVRGSWNEKFLGQLDGFTQILHDDRITPVTGAMYVLNHWQAWKKTTFVSL